jgi:hypothetical protein
VRRGRVRRVLPEEGRAIPCLKQQIAFVKHELSLTVEPIDCHGAGNAIVDQQRHYLLLSVLGSLENLQARVEAEVERHRARVALQQELAASEPEL